MTKLTCTGYSGDVKSLGGWIALRANTACNSVAGSPNIPASIQLSKVPESIGATYADQVTITCGSGEFQESAGTAQIQEAALNACLAQRLRNLVPGSSGAEALFLSGAEQRELRGIIRDRASLAALQFARLGLAFGSGPAQPDICLGNGGIKAHREVDILAYWALQNPERATRIAGDYASTVELLRQLTEEDLQFMSRNASARSPRGPKASSLPDEDWGAGSWRQRSLALLFGGDPLSAGSGPDFLWHEIVHKNEAWPTANRLPYVRTRVDQPQVHTLRQLALECGTTTLTLTPPAGGVCDTVNRSLTADRIFRETEACVRTRECWEQDPATNGCKKLMAADLPPTSQFADFALWKTHRIHPDHAGVLANVLGETFEPLCRTVSNAENATDRISGMVNVDGTLTSLVVPAGTPRVLRIEPGTRIAPKPLKQLAGQFTRKTTVHVPVQFFPNADSVDQEIYDDAGGITAQLEEHRMVGSSSALAAVRDALLAGMIDGDPAVRSTYLSHADRTLDLIDGAIGSYQVSIRKKWHVDGDRVLVDDAFAPVYVVDVLAPASDPDFSSSAGCHPEGGCTGPKPPVLYASSNDPWAASLTQHEGSKVFNRTAATVAQTAMVSTSTQRKAYGSLVRWRFEIALSGLPSDAWTFFVRLPLGTVPIGTPPKRYRLVAGSVLPGRNKGGQHIAGGGTLGLALQRMMTPDNVDPASPAMDAFGIPLRWVPPTNPTLSPGKVESAGAFYLSKAKAAADEATAAVEKAMDTAIQEEVDSAAQASASVKAQKIAEEEQKAICGDGNTGPGKCDLSTSQYAVDDGAYAWCNEAETSAVESCLINGAGDECANFKSSDSLKCIAGKILQQGIGKTTVHNAVWKHRDDPQPPAFNEFTGGSAHTLLLREWTTMRQIRLQKLQVEAATEAARQRYLAMDNELANASAMTKEMCKEVNKGLIQQGHAALGHPLSKVGIGKEEAALIGGAAAAAFTGGAGFGVGSSVGGMLGDGGEDKEEEAKKRCLQASSAESNLAGNQAAAAWEASSNLQGRSREYLQAVVEFRTTVSEIQQLENRAKLNSARAQMEAELLAGTNGLRSQFGLYRRVHQYDMWRAKAMIESARLHAVIARRAIESELLVDLSDLKQDEPLVARPGNWADDVYEYDLSLPAAVGLSVSTPQTAPGSGGGGIYTNKLKDYLGNLEKFVLGFPIARPTAVAQADADVVSITGPSATITNNEGGKVLDPAVFAWSFLCNGGWRGRPADQPLATVCESELRPTRARVTFHLDAWARKRDGFNEEPYYKRYNARWQRVAVNLVGTGILDCTKAKDPAACYSQSFLRYDLSQTGSSWTQNYDQQWWRLLMPAGRIEGAKALAAEEWLDPVSNGFAKPFVTAVARTEFNERPFDGTYTLELELPAEAKPERIDRVQLLLESSYWVKQQLAPTRRSLPCVR